MRALDALLAHPDEARVEGHVVAGYFAAVDLNQSSLLAAR
jgi:hypothetical protein